MLPTAQNISQTAPLVERPSPPSWFDEARHGEHTAIIDQLQELNILRHASPFAIDRLASLRVEWGQLAQIVTRQPGDESVASLANALRRAECEARLLEKQLGLSVTAMDKRSSGAEDETELEEL